VSDFDIKAEADGSVTRVLLTYQSAAQSIDKATPVIAKMLHAAVLDVFEAEGPGWQKLELTTLAKRRGGAGMILQDTGIMAGTLGEFHGFDYSEVAAAASYSIYHVSKLPRRHLPLRDFTNLGPFEGPLLEDVAEFIANQVAT
jgi:phage gpG-like protein